MVDRDAGADEPARMARSGILLVGGKPLVAEMLTDYFHYDDRYEVESVEYCDDALAMLERRRFDLVLVLSLHVPWTMWPASTYSPERRADLLNAILLLKHLRALHSPPPIILVSGSLFAKAEEEALADGAFAFIHKPFDLAELDRFVRLALESRKGSMM